MERDFNLPNIAHTPLDFNSHAHVERDAENVCQFFQVVISTHTLTWSVTLTVRVLSISFDNFNSHAHVERDV